MAEVVPIDERVATLEVQVKDIPKQEGKIDKLMDLVNDVKQLIGNMKNEYMPKVECKANCAACENKFEKLAGGQKKLFWAAVTATFAIIAFLLQQLLHITLKLGVS